MKKLPNLILIILLLIFSQTYSQKEGAAIYKVKNIEKESENPEHENLDKNTLEILKKTEREFENLEFKLIFNNEFTFFSVVKKLEKSNNTFIELAKTLSGYSGEIYVDNKKQLIIDVKDVMGKRYFIEKKIDDYNWKINKNKVNINGYDCFKATTILTTEGRNGVQDIIISAWFTPEINLSYGPNGFSGLPGMIVQIQKGNIITYLSEINFQTNDKKIQLPTAETITSKDFNKMMKELNSTRGNY